MRMPANSALKAQNPAPDPAVDFALVEALCIEIPAKFRQHGIRVESAVAGFTLGRHRNDSGGRFTLSPTFPAT
ncbi:hypothetical protein ABT088_37360 [Streptomyces mirabilis]|uniref:hypothetical protein n=1 Tax=Streptomyces TaxID=1883 RepID=UPI0029A8B12E|nr:hypothetical protein [Streptomyces sp. AK02-04a]MDX3761726.1 hypothetical protein [Streptomyces sp. AK02-04a]